MARRDGEERWTGAPRAAAALRALIVLVPVAAGLLAAWGLSLLLPRPASIAVLLGEWLVLAAASTAVIVLVERAVRRVAPLALLLKLSLLFPGPAPSRFRVALRAGSVRSLERRLLEGTHDDPSRAAELILSLASAISAHDRRTRGHSERVRAYAEMLGEELRVEGADLERLRWAALLHDVGKLRVPALVLNKDSSPDHDEWELIHRHPIEGARLAAGLMPWLGPWGAAIRQHHERFDGSGYPDGLVGEDISLAARVVAVADAYETMTAARPYHRPVAPQVARQELARCGGTHFDPEVVRAFLNLSVARLRRLAGPLVWLAELPLLRPLRSLGTQPAATTVGAAGVAALAAFGSLAAMPPSDLADHRPPVSVTAQPDGDNQVRIADVRPGASGEMPASRPPAAASTVTDTPTGGQPTRTAQQVQTLATTGPATVSKVSAHVAGPAGPARTEARTGSAISPAGTQPEPSVPPETDGAPPEPDGHSPDSDPAETDGAPPEPDGHSPDSDPAETDGAERDGAETDGAETDGAEAPPAPQQRAAPPADDDERGRKGRARRRRTRPDGPPPHASAHPEPDTTPGAGANPDPRDEDDADARSDKETPARGGGSRTARSS